MQKTYTTISGQTWDAIAYVLYGNEYYCTQLMDENRDKLDYFVFPDGIVLKLPEQDAIISPVSANYPKWRALLNGK